jgi:co-chaperonin GroES (HSP10)
MIMQSSQRAKELKTQIEDLVTQAYRECGLDVVPKRGTYLIRVLPKETVTKSGVILADMGNKDHQNKPNYEGVVLATFAPYEKNIEAFMVRSVDVTGSERVVERVEPLLSVGDHILFPHYEGIPIPSLDLGTGEYRIINEESVVVVISYDAKKVDEKLHDEICSWLESQAMDVADFSTRELVETIRERFNVVSKDLQPKTLSGE